MPLVEQWTAAVQGANGQGVFFPGDLQMLQEDGVTICPDLETYQQLTIEGQNNAIHSALLPCPYGGNLENASVYLLLLNAGFAETDYAELHNHNLNDALTSALVQANAQDEYPFLSFDPLFNPPDGESWWRAKIGSVATALSDELDYNTEDMFRALSSQVAVLEAFPYHSKKFGLRDLVRNGLPSSMEICDYVHQMLVPRARNGDKLIVALRANWHWNLVNGNNVIVYPSVAAQAASLDADDSPGGMAIVNFLRDRLL